MVAFSKTHTPSSRSHETRWREEESIYSVTSKPTFKDFNGRGCLAIPTFCTCATHGIRDGWDRAPGGKRVERVAIREDSRESVRWAAEEKRDVGTRNETEEGKEEIDERGRERTSCIVLRAF